MNNCFKCGNAVQPGTDVCPICGTSLKVEQPAVNQSNINEPSVNNTIGGQTVGQATPQTAPVQPVVAAAPVNAAPETVVSQETPVNTSVQQPVAPIQPEVPSQPVAPSQSVAPSQPSVENSGVQEAPAPAAPAPTPTAIDQPINGGSVPAAPVEENANFLSQQSAPSVSANDYYDYLNKVNTATSSESNVLNNEAEVKNSSAPEINATNNLEAKTKSSGKKLSLGRIFSYVLVMAVSVGGTFLFMNNRNKNLNQTTANNSQEEVNTFSYSNGFSFDFMKDWIIRSKDNSTYVTDYNKNFVLKFNITKRESSESLDNNIISKLQNNTSFTNTRKSSVKINGSSWLLVDSIYNNLYVQYYYKIDNTNILTVSVIYNTEEIKDGYEKQIKKFIESLSYSKNEDLTFGSSDNEVSIFDAGLEALTLESATKEEKDTSKKDTTSTTTSESKKTKKTTTTEKTEQTTQKETNPTVYSKQTEQ